MSDPQNLQAQIEQLQAQLKALQQQAQAEDGSAIAQGTGAKSVAKGGILIEGDVYTGPKTDDPAEALRIYRRVLVQSTASLPLRGVDVGASDPTGEQKSIGLANVYVDLDTKSTLVEEIPGTAPDIDPDETEFVISRQDTVGKRTLAALEAVVGNSAMVLLGDPGSGKSTFVNFLAHCLAAHALEPEKGWLKHLNNWPSQETKLLPVLITLRDFARSHADNLPAKAEPCHLLNFIQARLEAQKLAFALPPIVAAPEAGRAIILLDGLDEVPTQQQRIFVRDAVRAFMQRYGQSRFLITCRVLSYQPPQDGKSDPRLNELPNFELAALNEEKIKRFVSAWYAELGRLGTVPGGDVPTLTTRLQTAVHRADLQRLAANPLLLTVMSLVHTHRGRLPDARTLLYEETVEILLWRWEQIKLGGQADAPRLRQYLLLAGRTDVDLKRVIWKLAYQAHSASKPGDGDDTLADIPEHRILKALAALKSDDEHPDGDLNWAKRLVNLMKMRAGLLLERQPAIFAFPHRTFQEYLAGAHLAAQADFSRQISQLAQKDMSLWREVILYAAGKLVYVNGDVEKPLALVAELCPDESQDNDSAWRLAWLAADVLLEIGLKRVRDSGFGRDLLKRAQTRLKNLLEGGKLAPQERARAGNTLAALGDPRFNQDHWHLPAEPMMGFKEIPAGVFVMGSDKNQDELAYDREFPQHELTLPRFWMARYPVTVTQFRAFVDESGYNFDNWKYNSIATHPVVNVNWHEALKYCDWLTEKLSAVSHQRLAESVNAFEREFWQGLSDGSLVVTLPSEAQWEKSARGSISPLPAGEGLGVRAYPWGKEFDPDKANTADTRIGTTSTVGCFPAGVSPYDILDLSGNVFEWTRSITYQKFPYPYNPNDGRENMEDTTVRRVLRGGAFHNGRSYARCASRNDYDPRSGFSLIGFRVVVVRRFSHSS